MIPESSSRPLVTDSVVADPAATDHQPTSAQPATAAPATAAPATAAPATAAPATRMSGAPVDRRVGEDAGAAHGSAAAAPGRLQQGAPIGSPVTSARAARALICAPGQESVETTLRQIVEGALATVPEAERVSISYVERDGAVTSRSRSDHVATELDTLQSTLREGPSAESLRTQRSVVVDDMSSEGRRRWPRFAAAALAQDLSSVCCVALFARHDHSAGTLNFYSSRPAAFDDATVAAAELFAANAALALHGAQRLASMEVALASRDVIGQAKGILAERFKVSDEKAFGMLVESSQLSNLKLRAVADWLVGDTHQSHTSDRPSAKDSPG